MEFFIMGFAIIGVIFLAGFAGTFIQEQIEDAKYRNKPKLIFIWVAMTIIILCVGYWGYTFLLEQYNNMHQIRVNGVTYTD